ERLVSRRTISPRISLSGNKKRWRISVCWLIRCRPKMVSANVDVEIYLDHDVVSWWVWWAAQKHCEKPVGAFQQPLRAPQHWLQFLHTATRLLVHCRVCRINP